MTSCRQLASCRQLTPIPRDCLTALPVPPIRPISPLGDAPFPPPPELLPRWESRQRSPRNPEQSSLYRWHSHQRTFRCGIACCRIAAGTCMLYADQPYLGWLGRPKSLGAFARQSASERPLAGACAEEERQKHPPRGEADDTRSGGLSRASRKRIP